MEVNGQLMSIYMTDSYRDSILSCDLWCALDLSCDIYEVEGINEQRQVEAFMRFLEYINKIRRPGFIGSRPVRCTSQLRQSH